MTGLLQSGYLSVLDVSTRDELQDQVVRFTHELGFQTVTAITVIDHFLGEPEFISIDNAPAGYREIGDNQSNGKRDPVMQHCKHKSVPIIWNQATYVDAGQAEKWEEQARFGYRNGIAFALHMPHGRHFMLGVDRDQALSGDPAEAARLTAWLMMFAVHAQDAAMRVLKPSSDELEFQALTTRELATLQWTVEGKTSWEVGRILGIAENTVVRHAQNATHKLGCANKHHAAVKALRLGLIK